jgi:hypothetical protein
MSRVHFGRISIDAPPDWTVSTVVLVGPAVQFTDTPRLIQPRTQQSFQSNIVATSEKVDADEVLERYVQRQLEDFQQAGVSRKELMKPEEVQLDNDQAGILWEHAITAPGGQLVGQIQLVTIKDGFAYSVIASCLYGPAYEKDRENLRRILLSFQ